MQEKIIKELRYELKAQTDENQELLKINEEHQKINGELRKEIDGLVTVVDLAKNYIKDNQNEDGDYCTSYEPYLIGTDKLLEILERVNEE